MPDGQLLTVNDKDGAVFSIHFGASPPEARLVLETNLFAPSELALFATKRRGHYDSEGLARDEAGRIYLCEETYRWILRCEPKAGAVELLNIDWGKARAFFSENRNASFEGIAIHGDRLYVANEREIGRILVVDLRTLKLVDDFQALPLGIKSGDIHYSDLSWFDDSLWVLCRENRCVLRVDVKSHDTLAQFDYGNIELAFENRYAQPYPFGFVEGLAVDANWIWLVVDNNGFTRVVALNDWRPTLWRCRRPDRPTP